MIDTITPIAVVLIPLGAALISYMLRDNPRASAATATVAPLLSAMVLLVGFRARTPITEVWWSSWVPGFLPGVRGVGFVMKMDGLSLAMCLTTCVLYAAAMLFALPYLEERGAHGAFYSLSMLLLTALMGVFLSWNLLAFFVFWELMSVPSFFMISEWGYGNAREAAMKFFLYTRAGALLILLALAMIYNRLGTLDLDGIAALASSWPALTVASFLMTVGFVIKAGCFPLHSWLPDAHSQAPAPFSALLSGILVATGIYSTLRISLASLWLPGGGGDSLPTVLTALGLASAYFGAFRAMKETDIKRIPAYSTISHMGYALTGLGLGTSAVLHGHPEAGRVILVGSMFHLVAHAWSKGLLFLSAGSVMHLLRRRDIMRMGGGIRLLPMTSVAMIASAMSIAGSPPFPCFISEVSMITGSASSGLHQGGLIAAALAFATVLSAGYALRLVYHVTWRTPPEGLAAKQAVIEPFEMKASMLVLTILLVLTFFVPMIVLSPIDLTVLEIVG